MEEERTEDVGAEDMDAEMPYIDRVVAGVEQDGDDDSTVNGEGMEEDGDDGDESVQYDSDEDLYLQIKRQDYTPRNRESDELSEESKALLLWRMGEEESFSDWSIEVTVSGDEAKPAEGYHVHRSALAIGPKKSGYFEALFQSGQFRESSDRTSKVALPGGAAKCFPDFLDYLYAHPSECDRIIKRGNWQPLRYLAGYFLVPRLTADVERFVEEDVYDLDHLMEYLAMLSGTDEDAKPPEFLLPCVTKACAEMILPIAHSSSPPLESLSPAFFLKVMSMLRMSESIKSMPSYSQRSICDVALAFIDAHRSSIDDRYFYALASEMYFPSDEHDAKSVATQLLRIMKDKGWERGGNDATNDGTNEAGVKIDTFGSGVKESCIAVLSRFVSSKTRSLSLEDLMSITATLPNDVASILLAEAWHARKAPVEERTIDITCTIDEEYYAMPIGSVITISCRSTDTINYIRYLLGRKLNVAVSGSSLMGVFLRGSQLSGAATVSECNISSRTTLTIKGRVGGNY